MNHSLLQGILELANDAIVSVDENQHIVLFNRGAEQIFGYTAEEALGEPLDVLIPAPSRSEHQTSVQDFARSSGQSRLMGRRSEIRGLRKGGAEFPAEASISRTKVGDKTFFTAILRDISKRKETEEQLQASLEEKEVLLKEVHHRVKNNLQIISSLLNLQSRHTEDPKALEVIKESQNRVKSIALVHESLYRSSDLSRVDFGPYISEIASNLFRSYGNSRSVDLVVETNGILLGIDTAIPCGLMVNELLSNSMKHGLPRTAKGKIQVELSSIDQNNQLQLSVRDNGPGLPSNSNLLETKTLGLRLVMNLANQLGGNVEVHNDDGAVFTITFNRKE